MKYKNRINSRALNQAQEFEEDLSETSQVYFTSTPVFTNYHHRVFLDKEIIDEFYYREIIEIILSANEGDLIEVLIASPGGQLWTCASLINAVRLSKGFVRGIITSNAQSAAGVFALCCDELVAMPNSFMMIHNASGGFIGAFDEIGVDLDFYREHTQKLFRDAYEDFLTKDEIESVIKNGRTIHLTAEEINARVQRRQEIRQERAESAEAENVEGGCEDAAEN